MELRQLQHFLAVAEEQHFTRAAQRMNIVQSALSASIRALEDELDTRLFLRTTRQVRLSATGRAFLEKAQEALAAVQDARAAVETIKGLKRGRLSIGTVQSLPAFLGLPSLLAEFHAVHPAVEVRLRQAEVPNLLESVRTGRLDLAVLPLTDPPSGVTTTMIACEALVMVCAPGHSLAGRSDLPLSALRNEPFVDFEPDWGTRRLIDRAFAKAGVERRTAFEVSELDTLLELVAHGLGIALVPEAVAEARLPSLGISHLAEPGICWELVVAYVAQEGSSVVPAESAPREFLQLLQSRSHEPASLANDECNCSSGT